MSRYRVWTFITYPESLPTNFKEIIEEEITVPIVISPLHDKDFADTLLKEKGQGWSGSPYKKPHYHNMILFGNVKTFKQLADKKEGILKKLGVSMVQQVHSTQAMIRYFVHADQNQKAKYRKEDIQTFNGADIDSLFEKNDKEICNILKEMIEIINDNDIVEYSSFVNLCLLPEYFTDYFPLVVGKYQYFVMNYIKSKRFEGRIAVDKFK